MPVLHDRAKLAQAIHIAREKAGATHAHWWDITPEFLGLVFEAAEAHLATLPKVKTVYDIHASGVSTAPYEAEFRCLSLACITMKIDEFHRRGFTRITVVTAEVPA